MRSRTLLLLTAGALGAVPLGLPAAARAQYRTPPPAAGASYAAATTQAAAAGAAAGSRAAFAYNPYAYPPGYAYPYGANSLGNTLSGAADAITAQGQFNIQNQQAKLAQQQVYQAQIDTKRKQFDEYRYEKALTPTYEDIREEEARNRLRHARHDPPPAEIWSGSALNTLLKNIQQQQATTGLRGPAVPVDTETVQHVNLSGGTAPNGIGPLKSGGMLEWPLGLQDKRFDTDRQKIETLVPMILQQAASGRVQGKTQKELLDVLDATKVHIKAAIEEMSPGDNVKANRYINELRESVRVLDDPNTKNYFNGNWQLKVASVGDMVEQMTRQGLRFAPAASGDEPAYQALYNSLVAYDAGIGHVAAR
jgi:hypothetical protein